MLKHFFTYVLLLLFTNAFYSQTELFRIPNSLKEGSKQVKDAFTIVDENSGDLYLFLDDNNTFNLYHYNNKLELINTLSSPGLPNSYSNIIGHTIGANGVRLFLTNKYYSKFGSVLFDFEKSGTLETEYPLELKKDIPLTAHSYLDSFTLISLIKNSSSIVLYQFKHDNQFTGTQLDLEQEFLDMAGKKTNLHKALIWYTDFNQSNRVRSIDAHLPITLDRASEMFKSYSNRNNITISFDQNAKFTYLLNINTTEKSQNLEIHDKPILPKSNKYPYPSTNSLIYQDKIALISVHSENIVTHIKDRKYKTLIKSLEIDKNDSIRFKNGPIKIKAFKSIFKDRERDVEKNTKFLRKLSKLDIGVAITSHSNGHKIIIGGVERESKSWGALPIFATGGFGGVIFSALSSTAALAYTDYRSYEVSKSVFIQGNFDANYNHVQYDFERPLFERIKEFEEKQGSIKGQNIFKYQNNIIYGRYDNDTNEYILVSFGKRIN